MSQDFRKAVRNIAMAFHGHQHEKLTLRSNEENDSSVALFTPVLNFVKQFIQNWHDKLVDNNPSIVANQMRSEKKNFPLGMTQDHFRWLCRFMARWHRRNAGKCNVMSAWSSGNTGDDSSDGQELLLMVNRNHINVAKEADKSHIETTVSNTESPKQDDVVRIENVSILVFTLLQKILFLCYYFYPTIA